MNKTTKNKARNYSIHIEVIKQGKQVRQVAIKHGVSETTVKNIVVRLYQKLCSKNQLIPQGWTLEIIRKDNRFESEAL